MNVFEHFMRIVLTLEFALLTAGPILKAAVSIFDALMTFAPTNRTLALIAF